MLTAWPDKPEQQRARPALLPLRFDACDDIGNHAGRQRDLDGGQRERGLHLDKAANPRVRQVDLPLDDRRDIRGDADGGSPNCQVQGPVGACTGQLPLEGDAEVDVGRAGLQVSVRLESVARHADSRVDGLVLREGFEEGGVGLHAHDRVEDDPSVTVMRVEPLPEGTTLVPERITTWHEFRGPTREASRLFPKPFTFTDDVRQLDRCRSLRRGQLLEVLTTHPLLIGGVVLLLAALLQADDAPEGEHQAGKCMARANAGAQVDGLLGDVGSEGHCTGISATAC